MDNFLRVLFLLLAALVTLGMAAAQISAWAAGQHVIGLIYAGLSLCGLLIYAKAKGNGIKKGGNPSSPVIVLPDEVGWVGEGTGILIERVVRQVFAQLNSSTAAMLDIEAVPHEDVYRSEPDPVEGPQIKPACPDTYSGSVSKQYLWLDSQLKLEQKMLKMPDLEARLMRSTIFAECARVRQAGRGRRYPYFVADPLAMDVQVEFAKRVRSYRVSLPRGDSFCTEAAELLANAVLRPVSAAQGRLRRGFFMKLTPDELLIRFFYQHGTTAQAIAELLALSAPQVQHTIHEVEDVVHAITERAVAMMREKAADTVLNPESVLSEAWKDWLQGRQAA